MLIQHLEAIEAAPRGNARLEAIGHAIKAGGPTVQRFLVDANDPFKTFGIAKLPKPEGGGLFFQNEEQWVGELFGLAEKLAARTLTGNEMKARVAAFLDDCNELQEKWSSRFLLKDLRLNVGAKDLQKILGKKAIYLFEVPLAHDYKDFKKWKDDETWYIQPKLDGGRCVAMFDRLGTVTLFSRNGKVWGNFESVRLALQKWATVNDIHDYVLDGEVVSLDESGRIDFQQIQKTMMRRDGVEVGKLQYVVFDGCPLTEWQDPQRTYRSRRDNLEVKFEDHVQPTNVRLIETTVSTRYHLKNGELMCEAYVKLGYEGAIMRKADAVVANKRSKDLLKVKTFEDAEAVVTGVVEGTGKYAGMLGALKCEFPASENSVAFEIGSGFNDAQRHEFWVDRSEEIIGKTVVLSYFEKTNDGLPRFPIFKGFRSEDDIGEAK